MNPMTFKINTGHFGSTTEQEKRKILLDKTAKNTNRATEGAIKLLQQYLNNKQKGELCKISNEDLPQILEDFYTDMRTKKHHDLYTTQSMKCIRSNLNRNLKTTRKIDVIMDPKFVVL